MPLPKQFLLIHGGHVVKRLLQPSILWKHHFAVTTVFSPWAHSINTFAAKTRQSLGPPTYLPSRTSDDNNLNHYIW